MSEAEDAALFEAARAEIETRMLALAVTRFGAEAAARLRPVIAELAADAARVQLYPVDPQLRPAFYLNAED
jgi:DNA-binding FadR family transcriptional regulator